MNQDNKKERKLHMTFDPLVIDDLGAKLYSTLPPIISELIANGYDACAKKVYIELIGTGAEKKIIVTDDGIGMSFDEVEEKYLRIGRKKRESEDLEKLKCDRLPIGKKGLGKLAFFGVARKAIVETIKDGEKTIFEMDWEKIQAISGKTEYEPIFSVEKTSEKNGTKITLTHIERRSNFNTESLKKSISNYFIFDSDFKVFIKDDSDSKFQEIDNEIRYKQDDRGEDFSWLFPEKAIQFGLKEKFPFVDTIKGKIILFDKPVKDNLRGVTLFSRKKLVSVPESFPVQGSSHFFQYLTGWLEIDFIDDLKPDVIATNRSSLNWNDENLESLKEFLEEVISNIHKEWRLSIKKRTTEKIKQEYKIDTAVWRDTNKNNSTIVKNIDRVVKILDDPERIEEDEVVDILGIVHSLAPENADFVLWSGLHEKIRENRIIKEKFFTEKYLEAAREAVQIYNEEVQRVSGSREDGCSLMDLCFRKDRGALIHLTDKLSESEQNIDLGQQFLSKGVITGFRNPALGHTSLTRAQIIRVFSDRNCLDILNTISYLFDRLGRRKNPVVL
jgi:uncharacterized protein (TIGR02391 family)